MHENMKTSMWHTGRSERTWRLPACSQYYSILFARWHRLWFEVEWLRRQGQCRGYDSCKMVFLGAFSIHLFRQFGCRMYRFIRLATMHSVTDGRTDRRQYDRIVVQYDQLKTQYNCTNGWPGEGCGAPDTGCVTFQI